MTNSSTKQILESVAEQAERLKERLADTRAAIQRGREDDAEGAGAGADAPAADRDGAGDETGRSNVLPFVRRQSPA